LLEDIQGKTQLTMEAVTGFRGAIDALRTELSQRIDIIELAVRQNSLDIRQNTADIRKNSEDIRQNTADIHQLRVDLRQNTEDIHQFRAELRQNTEEIRSMRELLERKADHEALLRLETRVQVVERRLGIQ
jgi:trimeric autotransporter adhesin